MLREEVEQYTKLKGEDGWNVPIMKVGAYLDGYNKGLEVLDKIRAEIKEAIQEETVVDQSGGEYERIILKLDADDVLQIIDKYKAESEDKE